MSGSITGKGNCLCGAIRITAININNNVGACYCGMCRKWGGGPLMAVNCGTNVSFEGEDNISVFNSSDWAERGFCKKCGSHLFYRLLDRLLHLSVKELDNEKLSTEEYNFIKNFGEQLGGVIADVDEKAKKTTIVADVHTDQNTKQVLEEGVGYVKLMIVAYKVPDGRILMGAGPVMSYYEFKHPMEDRLTDEKWRKLLAENPPDAPIVLGGITK